MSERYPELDRCLRCQATVPPEGGDWPLYLSYSLTTPSEEVVSLSGPLCSMECANVVAKRPALWSKDYPEPPALEEPEEVEP